MKWRFSNEAHKKLFQSDPEAYMPRYGGFCSGAMSRGFKARIDPEAFSIIDGKLYLASHKVIIGEFEENSSDNVPVADENWNTLRQTE